MALAAAAVIAVGACTRLDREPAPSARSSSAPSAAASVAASAAARRPHPPPRAPAVLGPVEGALNLVAWAGYVVGGHSGASRSRATTGSPRSRQRPVQGHVKAGLDSSNMVQLMKTGQYDGVSASGDATLRLIAAKRRRAGELRPHPELQGRVRRACKDQPYNTVNGVGYGVPHGRGANVLMYDPTVVTTAPDSWSVVFDANSPYKGKVTRVQLRDLHRRRRRST